MATFFPGIDALIGSKGSPGVNFAAKYLWDVRMIDQPTHQSQLADPFNKWLSVSDITVEEANLGTYDFQLANQGFSLPGDTAQKMINMTFYDSEDYDIFTWLRTWINNDILNKNLTTFYTSRLAQVVKQLYVTKLYSDLTPVESAVYYVFPKAALMFEGMSQPVAQQYTIQFVIAGSEIQE